MLRRSIPCRSAGPALTSYLTDVEGCYDFWNAFVARSKVLCRKSLLPAASPNVVVVARDDDASYCPVTAPFTRPGAAATASVAAGGVSPLSARFADPSAAEHDADDVTFRPEYLHAPNVHFVFGGDAFDKGPGDIRFARDLLSLKRRFPGRVHIVLGNRDTNKLKLRTEMRVENRDRFVLPQPYYLTEKSFLPYDKFLASPTAAAVLAKKYNDSISSSSSGSTSARVLLLKYLLAHRMGSAELFEFRRRELSLGFHPSLDASKDHRGAARPVEAVSDEEVLESFWAMCDPKDGIYAEFVRQGCLGVVTPGAAAAAEYASAFVHGSINDDALGIVPEMSMRELPYFAEKRAPPLIDVFAARGAAAAPTSGGGRKNVGGNVREWLAALNSFKDASVVEWEEKPVFDADGHRGGAALFGYGHSRCIGDRTVEVSTYLAHAQPANAGMATAALLSLNGIQSVGVGHQPIGSTPLPIREPGGLTIVMGDVSYSDKLHSRPPNGRGHAVAEVIFDQRRGGRVTMHGCDSNGDEYVCVLNGGDSAATAAAADGHLDDRFTGKAVAVDGGAPWWVVGRDLRRGDDKNILVRRTTDAYRTFDHRWMSAEEAEQTLAEGSGGPGRFGFTPQAKGKHFEDGYKSPLPGLFPDTPPASAAKDVTREAPHKSKVKPAQQ